MTTPEVVRQIRASLQKIRSAADLNIADQVKVIDLLLAQLDCPLQSECPMMQLHPPADIDA